jgi:membrane protease subunit HflK
VSTPAQAKIDTVILERPVQAQGANRRKQAAGVVLLLWLLTSVFIVRTDQQAVVTRFGAIVDPRVMPGIHIAMPWPIDRVTKLRVQQLQRLVVGGELPDTVTGRTQPLQSQFLTGDQNVISMRVVVQFSVGVPADYLFRTENVARSVGAAVETALAERVAERDVDAVLTTERQSIQEEVRAEAQRILNEYRAGVLVSTINMESAVPPPEAADAFRDVASARADSSKIVSESQGYANDLIPKARGEAQQMLAQAQAYRTRTINDAEGDAARFTQVAAEYSKAADVNGERLYLETMEQILPRIKKLIVDKNGKLDLTIIRKGQPSQ